MREKPKIVVIVGPTASGKSDLAVKIARRFNGEIVSADSRQIYRGMNIGTAKPPPDGNPAAESKFQNRESKRKSGYFSGGIRHHLIDIKNPDRDYSVGQYKKDAIRAINRIIKSGKLPILVGGTGLYIDAVVKNIKFPEVKEDKNLRARLEEEIKRRGLNYVFQKLVDLDPEAAHIVDPKNPRRVIRALEVALISNKPFSAQRKIGKPLYDALQIGISLPPKLLKERIKKRIDKMAKAGLVEEVRDLVGGYGSSCKAFDAIGYREVIDYLKGKIGLNEALEQINKNTRHYARRQMTWFRKNKKTCWFKDSRQAISFLRQNFFCRPG
jgi:tRNA dimethylallyltransferase